MNLTKCPICRNITYVRGKLFFDNAAYTKSSQLLSCTNCGFKFVHPYPNEKKLAQIYSGVYHYAPKLRDLLVSFITNQTYDHDFQLTTSFVSPGPILDIGSGRGDFLKMFPAENHVLWAFDPYISASDEQVLRKKIGNHVNDYSSLEDYPKNTFSVILLRNIIEHTSKYKELLINCQKILKPGGHIFIRTPNANSLDMQLFGQNWYMARMSGHMVFFSANSFKLLCSQVGLKLLHTETDKSSALLSYFRSSDSTRSQTEKAILSVLYSGFSRFLSEGGDLIVILQKP